MKKLIFAFLALVGLLAAISCDEVDVGKRTIYVEPPQVSRAVLIEDFTGQYCVNCPKATEEIERLVEEYGDTAVIAVAIHSGPFSKRRGEITPLYTAVGDSYFSTWNLSAQPVGLVDRLYGPMGLDYTIWGDGVRQELALQAPVSIRLTLGSDQSSPRVSVQTIGLDSATVAGKLQVWLIEDSIDSFQYMPNGVKQEHYNHMHVFRAAVNGQWGDDITLTHGQVELRDYDIEWQPEWNIGHCAVVAFIYNEQGVLQVTKKGFSPYHSVD